MSILTRNNTYVPTVLPDGSWILYDSSSSFTVVLTPTAGIFWELCDGSTSIVDAIAEIKQLYPDQATERISADVQAIKDHLIALGVVRQETSNA